MPEIVRVRTVESDDRSHEHILLAGYRSAHIDKEPIMIPIPRVLEKAALMEEFWITVDGEKVAVKEGTCFVCGHEPYLVTEKDPSDGNLLLNLPDV